MVLLRIELKFQGKILRTRRQSRPVSLDISGVWRLGKPPLKAHLTPEKCGKTLAPARTWGKRRLGDGEEFSTLC
jgi:hypothetical protein